MDSDSAVGEVNATLHFHKNEALSLETNKKEIQESIYWIEISIRNSILKRRIQNSWKRLQDPPIDVYHLCSLFSGVQPKSHELSGKNDYTK
jgi:hypothetical protein